MRARFGHVFVRPGFDGEYGTVQLWDDDSRTLTGRQSATQHHAIRRGKTDARQSRLILE